MTSWAERELVTIGDVGDFAWSDLVHPSDLLVDAEYEFPWLARLMGKSPPAPQELPAVPAVAVLTVAACAVIVVSTLLLTPRSNPRRRRRRRK